MDLISEPLGISEKFELCMKGKSLWIILTIYYMIEKLTVVALQTKYKLCSRIARTGVEKGGFSLARGQKCVETLYN